MRGNRVLGVLALALILTSGCSANTTRPATKQSASSESTVTQALVRVPDLEDAIRAADTTATYDEDPEALADQLQTAIERYYAERGLRAVVEYQSIVLTDTQKPAAGSVVPSGTVVRLRIGFGD